VKLALTIVGVLVAALCGFGVLATINLHVFVEAHRDELIARGQRAVGRSVTIGSVAPSWWPIGIRFGDVVVGEDPRFGAGTFLDAAAVRVGLRPVALALGRVEVTRIVFDRPHITLVRDAAGRWNVINLAGGGGGRGDDEGEGERKRRHGLRMPPIWLGLAASEIRDGRIDVEDRSGGVPRRLSAVGVRVRASELRLGADTHIRADAAIFPGSVRQDLHLELTLSALGSQDGAHTPFVAHLEMLDADLETLALLAGRPALWSGRVARLTIDASGVLDQFGVTLAARSDGGWHLGPHLPLPPLSVRVDASAAVTRDAINLQSASGDLGPLSWTATGTATMRPWHFEAAVRGTGEAASLTVGERTLSLADLELIVSGDETVRLTPAHLRVDDMPIDGEIRIAGLDPLVGSGRAHTAGPMGVIDATFDVDSRANLRGRLEATDLDVGAIARRWAPEADTTPVTGHATVSATGSLPFTAEEPLRALAASGTARLDDGTVGMVNVASAVLHRLPAARLLPQLVTAATRARFPEVFEAEGMTLRSVTFPFTIAAGVLSSPRLVAASTGYEIVSQGTLDQEGMLRLHGDLVLSPTLSTALRADFPALRYLARADGQLVLPFRVRGPLDDPVAEPELKRIRARDLAGLVGAAGVGALGAPPANAPGDDADVQRLDRMIRP
jgi:hypothetical protein